MRRPITIKHEMEKIASHSWLINIGALLDAINLKSRFETITGVHCVDPKIAHADILASMIALMSIGKPDYDAIEIFREKQEFFNKAIGIRACPSSPTLRQRIDLIGNRADMAIKDASADLVRSCAPAISPIRTSAGFQNDGADISSSEFTTRYEVANFSKSERRTSICLLIGYVQNAHKMSICP